MTPLTFESLGLDSVVLQAIVEMGYETPSDIQAAAIPVMLSGADLIGQAQTGTGKTTAFGAPIIQFCDPNEHFPQALIMCPTRELALQVSEELKKLSRYSKGLQVCAVYGGESIEKQIRALKSGAQIIVGTPGRIMDHIDRGTLKLGRVGIVVLDEADEMLDMGFREDIESILESVPEERQTVLFSATMPPPIMSITKQYQRKPELIKIASKSVTVAAITQYYFDVKSSLKLDLMCRLIETHQLGLIMVFCNTKSMVDELTEKLQEKGLEAEALHGDLRQNQRTMVLNKFKKGKGSILVATDVAARGIDVDNVEAVFNYDVPANEEVYVHRIGRTGRAGKSGLSFTFCSNRENFRTLDNIRKYTKAEIQEGEIPSTEQILLVRQKSLKNAIFKQLGEEDIHSYMEMAKHLVDENLPADMAIAALLRLHLGALPSDEAFTSPRRSEPATGRRDRFDRDRRREAPSDRRSNRNDRENRSEGERRTTRSFREERPGRDSSRNSGGRTSAQQMTRIFINLGKTAKIKPGDIVGAITGETGISGDQIGHIEIHDNFTFVEVPRHAAREIADQMSKTSIRGKSVYSEIARN
jgi:ATP-dependent RNA helicase DeaD